MEIENRLREIEEHFLEVEKELSSPEVVSNPDEYKKKAKVHSDLQKVVSLYHEYAQTKGKIAEARELMDDKDGDIVAMAREEIAALKPQLNELENRIKVVLLPKDPNDEKNIIIEIRAGTGGDEAALFAADLFRMYNRYAENRNWKVEALSSNETEIGGFKEVIFSIEGDKVYSRLKYEGGTHRVQRVPQTEASGRVHTSAVTVAVLPEAEEVDIQIKSEDLKIDVFRSSGPGGQSVNTTDSAVRVTHLPSGLVVSCQDEKSQHKNKARALKVLRARLYEQVLQKQQSEISATRKKMIGSGDRSGRIRTYNFPQNRVSDHRINLTLYRLDAILEGDLNEIIDALILDDQTAMMKEA